MVLEKRIWIDGCFDFAHHGHAGAMLQARQLGDELYVGVHSDEEILLNKGPVVMSLPERVLAVSSCKWCTKVVESAPYVTDPKVMDAYECKYVVHGDDITTDANGEDCYQVVKDLGRFLVVKRTEGISTTDLVGRMLMFSKDHHIEPITKENAAHHKLLNDPAYVSKFSSYATDSSGKQRGSGVYYAVQGEAKGSIVRQLVEPSEELLKRYKNGAKVYYVDGGFDLFHPGHISLLKALAQDFQKSEEPPIVLVGLNDDRSIDLNKQLNYPIMNLFERSLCVLQCKYVDAIVIGAPYITTSAFLAELPFKVDRVCHGATPELSTCRTGYGDDGGEEIDSYREFKEAGMYKQYVDHPYADMSTETIVDRVLENRKVYEERQRKKGWKSKVETRLAEAEKAGKAQS